MEWIAAVSKWKRMWIDFTSLDLNPINLDESDSLDEGPRVVGEFRSSIFHNLASTYVQLLEGGREEGMPSSGNHLNFGQSSIHKYWTEERRLWRLLDSLSTFLVSVKLSEVREEGKRRLHTSSSSEGNHTFSLNSFPEKVGCSHHNWKPSPRWTFRR